MLVVWSVAEQRYRAVLEVLDGAPVTEVARRFGVSRQTVHAWLRRYAAEGGIGNLADRSSRPRSCPHQMPAAVEARVLVLRDGHPVWGADRIRWELAHEGVDPVPGRSSDLSGAGPQRADRPEARRRRRSDYRRWQRGRPMELWQMDVVGGIHLADGVEVKCVTGIDDNSRFVVSAKLVARATARPVCEALLAALHRHGVPEQILTDNGKVFTGRFGPNGASSEVLFDRICAENGIKHLLTAPRSPDHDGEGGAAAQDDAGGVLHRCRRPLRDARGAAGGVGRLGGALQHRASASGVGDAAPAERFGLVNAPEPVTTVVRAPRW